MSSKASPAPLPDAHIHLAALGIEQKHPSIAVTCTPDEFASAHDRYENLALGLHPWEIRAGNAKALVGAFMRELPKTQFIGEIGLDFYKEHAQLHSAQLDAFTSICKKLAQGRYLVSVHSRAAETATLDVLEATGTAQSCLCILHGFKGPGDQLKRARDMGCTFSFGIRELSSRRGREYARQLPAQRILLETDADGTKPFSALDWDNSLEEALAALSAIKGCDMRSCVCDNFSALLAKL